MNIERINGGDDIPKKMGFTFADAVSFQIGTKLNDTIVPRTLTAHDAQKIDQVLQLRDKSEPIKKINEDCTARFPKDTAWCQLCAGLKKFYGKTTEERNLEQWMLQMERIWQKNNKNIPITDQSVQTICPYYFHHKRDRGRDLYAMASMTKGKPLDEHQVVKDMQLQLQGKRILVLGDDSGSLSEVLNAYGAHAMGIENDPIKVLVARSGILSESGTSQQQVLQGDICDLADATTDLYRKIDTLEPFDIIYSNAVFNMGSGIEKAIQIFTEKHPEITEEYAEQVFGDLLTLNSMALLKGNGIMAHLDVDMACFHSFPHVARFVLLHKDQHISVSPAALEDYKKSRLLVEPVSPRD